MHDGQKNVIAFDKSLCIPILLGLPFLKHNNILIDIEANTAIDKKNNFDFLNPYQRNQNEIRKFKNEI